jgi:hypothetical protein
MREKWGPAMKKEEVGPMALKRCDTRKPSETLMDKGSRSFRMLLANCQQWSDIPKCHWQIASNGLIFPNAIGRSPAMV